MLKNKNIILVVLLVVIVGAIVFIQSKKAPQINPGSVNLSAGLAPEITDPTGFINTNGIKIHDQIGKVVLVDFWTYSCINCQRTLPYLKAWYAKYKDQGFEIIGIHTPEFDFEKNYNNVANFVKQNGITYPVVMDSNMGTWNAYGNQYWPADYLIDKSGKVADTHFGEGNYDATEHEVQKLLGLTDTSLVNPNAVVPSQNASMSQETYFGSNRSDPSLGLQLLGNWNIESEFAMSKDSSEKILYSFSAKNVYFVAGANNPTKIKILIDGKETQEITVQNNTLYQVYQGNSFGEHMLEIDVEGVGLQAYTFTFG